jgi:type II secretory pathway component PulC
MQQHNLKERKWVTRPQLWILNCALFGLLLIAVLIVLVTQQKKPHWESIEPTQLQGISKQVIPETVIAKIYENDLFDTYHRPTPEIKKKELEAQLPPPPTPLRPPPMEVPQPRFMDPIPIAVKGIIVVGDDQNNRVFIENTKTKEEKTFKIGDRIDDGQIIRIFRNRIILVRSNGQEEVLYLRAKDAKLDPAGYGQDRWADTVKKVGPNNFIIDPHDFAAIVPTLADLIHMLDPLTVYQKGHPIGTRIGTMEPTSIGIELGLVPGDIITSIAGMPTTDARSKLHAYHHVIALPLKSVFDIAIIRGGRPQLITITLDEVGQSVVTLGTRPTPQTPRKTVQDLKDEKQKLLERRVKLAPTLQELRKREKQTILRRLKKKELNRAARMRSTQEEL